MPNHPNQKDGLWIGPPPLPMPTTATWSTPSSKYDPSCLGILGFTLQQALEELVHHDKDNPQNDQDTDSNNGNTINTDHPVNADADANMREQAEEEEEEDGSQQDEGVGPTKPLRDAQQHAVVGAAKQPTAQDPEDDSSSSRTTNTSIAPRRRDEEDGDNATKNDDGGDDDQDGDQDVTHIVEEGAGDGCARTDGSQSQSQVPQEQQQQQHRPRFLLKPENIDRIMERMVEAHVSFGQQRQQRRRQRRPEDVEQFVEREELACMVRGRIDYYNRRNGKWRVVAVAGGAPGNSPPRVPLRMRARRSFSKHARRKQDRRSVWDASPASASSSRDTDRRANRTTAGGGGVVVEDGDNHNKTESEAVDIQVESMEILAYNDTDA